MYQQIYYDRKTNQIHLWDDKDGYSSENYVNYGFIEDSNGEYKTMDGKSVSKTFNVKGSNVYEKDVSPTTRTLIDRYLNDDAVSNNIKKIIIDIETEMITGTPDPEKGNTAITSIALYDYTSDNNFVLVLSDNENNISNLENVVVKTFKTENDLLKAFILLFSNINPHIVTHWNGDYFDMPYLYHRINNKLGERWLSKLSPIGIVKHNKRTNIITIAGVASLDYMILYKEYTYHEMANYTLDYISKSEIGEGKIEYDGNLDELFEKDINKFIEYNLVDVELIKKLDNKLKYIELTRNICHTAHIPYQDYVYSSAVIEGAILTYLRREKTVSINKPKKFNFKVGSNHIKGETKIKVNLNVPIQNLPSSSTFKIQTSKTATIECKYTDIKNGYFILEKPLQKNIKKGMEVRLSYVGAFVKDPKPGLYEWIYSIDLQSLYPSIIMSLNISPETKKGKILNWKEINFMTKLNFENGEMNCDINSLFSYINDNTEIFIEDLNKNIKVYNKSDFKRDFSDFKYRISSNGIIYDGIRKGIIPKILEDWFDNRLEYKAKKKNAKNDEERDFYDKRQLVQKILLNSTYGVLALGSFRFYDLDNASAITETGQSILKFSEFAINKYYQKINDDRKYIDLCQYEDTDSLYVLIPKEITNDKLSLKYVNNHVDSIATIDKNNVGHGYINEMLNVFSKIHLNTNYTRLKFNREKILRRGFWLAKKRYGLYVLDNEGKQYNEEEQNKNKDISVTGIDIVRSSFPDKFKDNLKNLLVSILKDDNKNKTDTIFKDLKSQLKYMSYLDIGISSSVKKIDDYQTEDMLFNIGNFKSGTPVAVKASISHNRLLNFFNSEKKFRRIKATDKIKYVYLKQNKYMMETLAFLPDNLCSKIKEFIVEYCDNEKIYNKQMQGKLDDFYGALNWNLPPQVETSFF